MGLEAPGRCGLGPAEEPEYGGSQGELGQIIRLWNMRLPKAGRPGTFFAALVSQTIHQISRPELVKMT